MRTYFLKFSYQTEYGGTRVLIALRDYTAEEADRIWEFWEGPDNVDAKSFEVRKSVWGRLENFVLLDDAEALTLRTYVTELCDDEVADNMMNFITAE
jgi:hypothetical protein